MPNVERSCTYRQSLTYLRDYYNCMIEEDREKLGKNILIISRCVRTWTRSGLMDS